MISGARRPKARCAVSDRRLAGAAAVALRPLLQESDGPRPRVGGQPKASASGQGEACASGQNFHPRRDAKNANADRLVTLHAKFISSHGWFAQGKLMTSTFLVAIDQGGE